MNEGKTTKINLKENTNQKLIVTVLFFFVLCYFPTFST